MSDWQLRMLYDGQCPFCRMEVRWLSRWDRKGHLLFEDIWNAEFDPAVYGLTREQVNGIIYGVSHDGEVVSGVEVFRQAYRILGMGWLIAPTGWPGLRPIFDSAYRLFARNRGRLARLIGKDCQGDTCSVNQSATFAEEPVSRKRG